MDSNLVMTVIGADRPGLVEMVAARVADHGGNWLESRMCRLGGQFAGILRVAVAARARDGLVNALRTLEVDVRASEDLIARMPKHAVAVSESGLKTADDLSRLRGMGYHAFLIGERFMTTEDPGAALKALLSSVGPDVPAPVRPHAG